MLMLLHVPVLETPIIELSYNIIAGFGSNNVNILKMTTSCFVSGYHEHSWCYSYMNCAVHLDKIWYYYVNKRKMTYSFCCMIFIFPFRVELNLLGRPCTEFVPKSMTDITHIHGLSSTRPINVRGRVQISLQPSFFSSHGCIFTKVAVSTSSMNRCLSCHVTWIVLHAWLHYTALA